MRVDFLTMGLGAGQTDELLFSLTLTERGIVAEPDCVRARSVLADDVVPPGEFRLVHADEDPELFMKLLPHKYRSPYFRAVPVQEGSNAAGAAR